MARKTKAPTQPTMADERELFGVAENETEYAVVRNKRMAFRDLCGWARHKITKITLGNGDEYAVPCKCLAAARLNGYFSIKLLWWILWRWYYFVRRYTDSELVEAVALIKKKVAPGSYLLVTTLLIGMRETMMQMNRAEVSATLQERSGGKAGKSAKIDPTSPSPSES